MDILTFGEALVEVMRTDLDQPLDRPALLTGPYPSGAPFIFAAQAARLGAKVAAVGAVGKDAFGKCLMDAFQADGIDTRGIQILDSHTTGVAFVAYRSDGSRDFVFHIKQAAAGQLHPTMLTGAFFDDLRVLHLMGSTLSIHADALACGLKALRLAKDAGAKISFDPNFRPQLMPVDQARIAFAPFVEVADVLIPTADELMLLTNKPSVEAAVTHLFDRKPNRIVVVTQGKHGCTVYAPGETHTVPAFAVQEVDPTGAGDCFDAGFLVQWLAGKSLVEAARFANACGALAVTQQGPMAGAYGLEKVKEFIQAHHA